MMFEMPGGGFARVCTKKDTYPNGKEFVGVGVQPDIRVTKSLKDFLENRDPGLEKAVEFAVASKDDDGKPTNSELIWISRSVR